MSTAKTLEKINDAIEEAIRPIISKGANMNAAELDVLTKAVCTLEKIQQIQEAGGKSITLGKRILRAETASIVLSALVLERMGELQ